MTRTCRRVAVALALPLSALSAQEAPAVAAGARVRVLAPKPFCSSPETWPCYRTVVGTLASIDSATIGVRLEHGDTVKVPRAPGTRLDVATGRSACSRHRGGCVGLGLLGGAAVGAAVGWISVQSQGGVSKCGDESCELVYVVTVPAGAVVGAIVGAVIGGGEDWEGADLPARLSVGPDGSGGLRFDLTLRF